MPYNKKYIEIVFLLTGAEYKDFRIIDLWVGSKIGYLFNSICTYIEIKGEKKLKDKQLEKKHETKTPTATGGVIISQVHPFSYCHRVVLNLGVMFTCAFKLDINRLALLLRQAFSIKAV